MPADSSGLGGASPIRVLVAEPDDALREQYRLALRQLDCDVVEALDGRDALVKAFVRVPSLVIMELRLPLIDGEALCAILRRDRLTADVPIVVVAAAHAEAREIDLVREAADVLVTEGSIAEVLGSCAVVLARSQRLKGRWAEAYAGALNLMRRSSQLRARAAALHPGDRRRTAVKAHQRFTTTRPPAAPPPLVCPACDHPLIYDVSHVGGVSSRHAEQWDYFVCPAHGGFQYRQRTHALRQLSPDEMEWVISLRGSHA